MLSLLGTPDLQGIDWYSARNLGLGAILVIAAVLLALRSLLRPVDHASPPAGKRWRLPPGPAGYPMIGNLLLFQKGEMAVSLAEHAVRLVYVLIQLGS